MPSNSFTEDEMRKALGLTPTSTDPKPKPAANPKQPVRYILVELSVRKQSGGLPFKFEHRSPSLSTLEARLEAEKAVRKQGLEVWAVLDIRQVEQ